VQINNISFQVIAVVEAKGYFAGVNEDDALRYPLLLWQSGAMDSNLLKLHSDICQGSAEHQGGNVSDYQRDEHHARLSE
jgi:hypothetical protein